MKLSLRKIIAGTALVSTGVVFFTSPLFDAAKLALSYAEPSAIIAFRLKGLSRERYVAKIEEAISENDFDDAQTIARIAQEQGYTLDPALLARTDPGVMARSMGNVVDFADGFIRGTSGSQAKILGSLASDLTVVGDVRDIINEGNRAFSDDGPDWVTLSLATLGLATSAATVGSLGTASPATVPTHLGVSVLKTAAKTRRLTTGLRRELSDAASHAIDTAALSKALGSKPTALLKAPDSASLRRLYEAIPSSKLSRQELQRFQHEAANLLPVDTTALRQRFSGVLRPEAAKPLTALAAATAEVAQNGGAKAAFRTLSIAENPAEIAKAAAISRKLGHRTSSTLRILGKSALRIGGIAYTIIASIAFLAFWIAGGIWMLVMFVISARDLLRPSPRRPPTRPETAVPAQAPARAEAPPNR